MMAEKAASNWSMVSSAQSPTSDALSDKKCSRWCSWIRRAPKRGVTVWGKPHCANIRVVSVAGWWSAVVVVVVVVMVSDISIECE